MLFSHVMKKSISIPFSLNLTGRGSRNARNPSLEKLKKARLSVNSATLWANFELNKVFVSEVFYFIQNFIKYLKIKEPCFNFENFLNLQIFHSSSKLQQKSTKKLTWNSLCFSTISPIREKCFLTISLGNVWYIVWRPGLSSKPFTKGLPACSTFPAPYVRMGQGFGSALLPIGLGGRTSRTLEAFKNSPKLIEKVQLDRAIMTISNDFRKFWPKI